MKKRSALLLSVILTGTILISCGDKTEEVVYANLTVQQNKEKIQDDGIATMEKLNGMSELTGVFAIRDLVSLTSTSSLANAPYAQAVAKFIAPIAQMDKNVNSLTSLRAGGLVVYGLISTFQEYGGIYTYNPATDDFTRVPSTTEITFNYPIGTSTTNNGKLTINNVIATASVLQESNADLVKSIDVALTKNNNSLFSLKLRAAYDSDETPTSWSTDISFVEGYKFVQNLTRSNGQVSWSMAYTLDGANLLSANFKTNGNFTNDALNNTGSLEDDKWIDQVLDNANATVQLGNLKVTGLVDVNKLIEAQDKTFPNGINNTKADIDKSCVIINQYVTLIVMYAKEGTAIAKSNFYTSEYTDWYYDYNTYQYFESTSYESSLQFIFKDGSAMDQSFFDQGFEDLNAAYMDMLTAFQTSYSE